MNFENLLLERDGFVVTITINRPKALNALNSATLRELKACLTELHHDHRDETLAELSESELHDMRLSTADIALGDHMCDPHA